MRADTTLSIVAAAKTTSLVEQLQIYIKKAFKWTAATSDNKTTQTTSYQTLKQNRQQQLLPWNSSKVDVAILARGVQL